MGKSLFEKDFDFIREYFPKLSFRWNTELKSWLIFGDLDICDAQGNYWETFDIVILFPKSYPYCVPIVIEKSKIIPREIDWHISPEGICCIDFKHSLAIQAKRGINVKVFIENKVYSYFANQLYKMREGKYASGEYGHHFNGTVQFYVEDLGFSSELVMRDVLTVVARGESTGRNDGCPCGSGKKIKHCHLRAIEALKSLGKDLLLKDLRLLEVFLQQNELT